MKRTRLNILGKSDTAATKREIQATLRAIVMRRDGKCMRCGVPVGTPGVVFQCDHLITRTNGATYSDSRLTVCICKSCHAWKSLGGNLRKAQYDHDMRQVLPKERVALWDRAEQDSWRPHRKYATDWKLELAALKSEYGKLCETRED